jgi:hypothetical protein
MTHERKRGGCIPAQPISRPAGARLWRRMAEERSRLGIVILPGASDGPAKREPKNRKDESGQSPQFFILGEGKR